MSLPMSQCVLVEKYNSHIFLSCITHIFMYTYNFSDFIHLLASNKNILPIMQELAILCLAKEEFAPKDLIILPVEISLLVQDCVTKYQHTPPTNWPVEQQ